MSKIVGFRLSTVSAALVFGLMFSAIEAFAANKEPLAFPQTRGADFEEILQNQSIGRVLAAPDGSFFLYEWSRPYDWAPSFEKFAREVAVRKQTFLYKVFTPDEWKFYKPPTSEVLIPAAPGATYYLGGLSPDSKWISFYELDLDDGSLRAGAAQIADSAVPKIVWFDLQPDDGRLDQPIVWTSDQEFAYPLKNGAGMLACANVVTEKFRSCQNAQSEATERKVGPNSASVAPSDGSPSRQASLPEGAKLVAASAGSMLEVYSASTEDVLEVLFKKNGKLVVLFKNERRQAVATR